MTAAGRAGAHACLHTVGEGDDGVPVAMVIGTAKALWISCRGSARSPGQSVVGGRSHVDADDTAGAR